MFEQNELAMFNELSRYDKENGIAMFHEIS